MANNGTTNRINMLDIRHPTIQRIAAYITPNPNEPTMAMKMMVPMMSPMIFLLLGMQ
jgi:hypothetical protein